MRVLDSIAGQCRAINRRLPCDVQHFHATDVLRRRAMQGNVVSIVASIVAGMLASIVASILRDLLSMFA